jgi:hypothetical protein
MADTLFESLSGLNFTPAENPYGIAATSIGQVAPQLITPYTSTGRAVGIGLGSILLQSLLGYQARSQAAQDTLQANTLANQMMSMTTPQARTEFIGGVEDPMYQSRLSTLATALNQQEVARKAKAADTLLGLETAANFELGPKGTELYQREIDKQATIQKAVTDRVLESERLKQGNKLDEEAQRLRREFNTRPEVKGYSKLRDAAAVIQLAEQDPSAVSSMELAKRAVHLIEPGLAALQGEVSAIENSASIPGGLKAKLKRALLGEGGLDEGVRKGIIDMGRRAYQVASQTYEETRKFYEDEATTAGIDPKRISSFGIAKPFEMLNQPMQLEQPDIDKRKAELRQLIEQRKQAVIEKQRQAAGGVGR